MKKWIAIIVAAVAIGMTLMSSYNGLVKAETEIDAVWANVESAYQRRADLIPNLVSTVKGYAAHEKTTLQGLTDARTRFMSAQTVDAKLEASNQLTGALKSLFAVAENYPDLKANQNFLELQTELSDIENKLAAARRFFNSATREYNTSIQSFPSNLIANHFGFTQVEFFELDDEAAKKAPKVQF